jgi:hypothetical protein
MPWARALERLMVGHLVGVAADPHATPPSEPEGDALLVTDQSPESGARVPSHWTVLLWSRRGDDSGTREPRRPSPGPRTAWASEPVVEAVGPAVEAVGPAVEAVG